MFSYNISRSCQQNEYTVALKKRNASSVQCYCATNIILFQKWIILFQTQEFTLTWPYSLLTALETPKIANFIKFLKSGVNPLRKTSSFNKIAYFWPTYEFLYSLELSHHADFENSQGGRFQKTCILATFPDELDKSSRFNA